VRYIWADRDVYPTRVLVYRLVPHLTAKCCIKDYVGEAGFVYELILLKNQFFKTYEKLDF